MLDSNNIYNSANDMNKINKTEDIFYYTKKNKKERCKNNTIKCCGALTLLIGMNLFSFYMGYFVYHNKLIDDGSY